MNQNNLKGELRRLFPFFEQTELMNNLVERSQLVELKVGQAFIDVDDYVKVVPLVLSGVVKVFRVDDEGNEILLYYIRAGESCAMTLSACIKREKSTIRAIVEEATSALALPMDIVHEFLIKFPSWNEFMVKTYSKRFEEVLTVVDMIAFQRMDQRLLRYLTEKSAVLKTRTFSISKTEIARDLNSSREVIFRLLKKMEERNLLRMEKNEVCLLINGKIFAN